MRCTWDYEYAIYNQNSTRGVREFSVPIPTGISITNVGFHDVAEDLLHLFQVRIARFQEALSGLSVRHDRCQGLI